MIEIPPDSAELTARYNKRLAIVVPYRDRAEHLAKFVPHMVTYFQRDKIDRNIAFSIHIVEQGGTGPFNRGKLRNVGKVLSGDVADYVCFHDVDYLPIWADYSWSPQPARLIWHGLTLKEEYDTFFGGVVLLDADAIQRVNGYSNRYWGWGGEDAELGMRCKLAGYEVERRDGTYTALPHRNEGFFTPGVFTPEARANQNLLEKRTERLAELMQTDGLTDLQFKLLQREPILIDGQHLPNSYHYLVDVGEPDSSKPA